MSQVIDSIMSTTVLRWTTNSLWCIRYLKKQSFITW